MSGLITVYARREPTTDRETLRSIAQGFAGKAADYQDVAVYRDKDASDLFVRYSWHHSSKPDHRFKYVTLNCYKWRLEWLN